MLSKNDVVYNLMCINDNFTETKYYQQFLQDLLDEEQKRHEEFLKGHWELMQMIEEARKEMHKYD